MSALNTNIPQGTDPILQSAAQLRSNFQAINQVFSDNHAILTGDPDILGMHSIMTMRPALGHPTTTIGQVALYNKLVSNVPALFFRPQNNATPIQLTYKSIVNTTLTQYSFIAGPFIVFYGFISQPTNGQIVTLSPGTTLIYADLTMAFINRESFAGTQSGAAATNINTPANSFTITYSNNFNFSLAPMGGVYYLAVGLP